MQKFVTVGDSGFNLDHVESWTYTNGMLDVRMVNRTFPHTYTGKVAERIACVLQSHSVAIIQKGEGDV